MKSGDVVKIIKVAYPFIREDSLGKTSKLLIKENNQYYLEDLGVYVSDQILTTSLDCKIDPNDCSIVVDRKIGKLVTIDDSINSFIERVEEEKEIDFEKYVKIYGLRIFDFVDKSHPKWIRAFEILNKQN